METVEPGVGGGVPASLQAHQRRPAQRERRRFQHGGHEHGERAKPNAGLAEGAPPRSVQRGDLGAKRAPGHAAERLAQCEGDSAGRAVQRRLTQRHQGPRVARDAPIEPRLKAPAHAFPLRRTQMILADQCNLRSEWRVALPETRD